MQLFSFPRRGAHGGSARLFILGLSLLLTHGVASAKNNNRLAKAGERPVARLISSPRAEAPRPPARARLVGATMANASYAANATASPVVAAVAATSDERRAFDLVNAERARRGLSPLALDGSLTRVARQHSESMADAGRLDHVGSDGLDLSGRVRTLGLRGWRALGENIAYNQGYKDPTAFAVERWMVSPKHRENILNGDFTHAGLGVARASDGRVFLTQVFMKR